MIEYRKAFQKKQTLKEEIPQGEGELNRDGNPKIPPGHGYSTNLQLEEAMKYDVLLVHEWGNQPLVRKHGDPVRMITPATLHLERSQVDWRDHFSR